MAVPFVLTVDTAKVLRDNAQKVIGVNLNYIRDADANRPGVRTLTTALKTLKVKWLRYPGGEKSDFMLWGVPPYAVATPISLGWYATVPGTRMNTDQYIAVARAVGAEPYVVAGYESVAHSGLTLAQWKELAVQWVRYANVVKGYKIKYWEIGNENWHNNTATASEMARIVVEIAKAMKAVDPSIRVGTSGSTSAWWATLLPRAVPVLDFLSVSLYNAWQWDSYERWLTSPYPDLIAEVRLAISAINQYAPSADRARLKVIVSETNSIDWSQGGWPQANTLGHAVVTFETLGLLLKQVRVTAGLVWTTRWMDDVEAATSQWYALGPTNDIQPTGRALQLWGPYLQQKLLGVTGVTSLVKAHASRSSTGSTLTAWIVNRGHTSLPDVRLVIRSTAVYRQAEMYQLRGTGPDDTNPQWGKVGMGLVTNNTVSGISCPGVSVTVLRCRT